MSIDLRAALAAAQEAALEVGPVIAQGFGVAVVHGDKATKPFDALTQFDIEAESRITERLARFDKTIPIRGEELGGDETADTTWLIDPIDATTHFARGTAQCTTMIALVDRGEVVVGVINDFIRNELYYATRNGGAFCNGDEIKMINRPRSESLLVAEIDTSIGDNLALWGRLCEGAPLMNLVASGSACASAAAGRYDGRLCKDPWGFDWDYAPGSLLMEEAGGVVRNLGTDTYDYRNHDFIATTPKIYDEIAALF